MNPIEYIQLAINDVLGSWIHIGSSASSDLSVLLGLI